VDGSPRHRARGRRNQAHRRPDRPPAAAVLSVRRLRRDYRYALAHARDPGTVAFGCFGALDRSAILQNEVVGGMGFAPCGP